MRVRAISEHFAFLLLAVTAASAEQFSFQDRELTQKEPHLYYPVPDAVPADWKAPVDYAGGAAHFRLEVTDKPTAVGVIYQACLEQDGRTSGKRACGPEKIFYEEGVYEWSQPMASFQGAATLDWSRRPQEVHLQLKDCYGKAVDPARQDWAGSPYLTLYYPMKARFSAAMVSKGGVFAGWPSAVAPEVEARRKPATLSWRHAGAGLLLELSRERTPGGAVDVRVLDLAGRTLFQWTRGR